MILRSVILLILIVFRLSSFAGEAPEAAFLEGKRYLDAGRFDRAEQAWKSLYKDSFLGPIVLLSSAEYHFKNHNYAASENLAAQLLQRYADTVYSTYAKELLARSLLKQGKPEAVPILAEFINRASEKDKPALILEIAELEKQRGNFASAAKHYHNLHIKFPASPQGLRAGEELTQLIAAGKTPRIEYSEAEETGRVERLFAKGRFDLAAGAYESMLSKKPNDNKVIIKIARCRFKQRDNERAIQLLKQALKGKLNDVERYEALHLLSLVYWRLDREKQFEEICKDLMEKGSAKYKRIAMFNLANRHLEKKRYHEAEALFNRLVAGGAGGQVKSDAKWKLAWIKYWKGDYAKAALDFQQCRSSGGKIENASKYWQARCLINSNRKKEAEPLLQDLATNHTLDYYGFEAAGLLKSLGATDTNVVKQPFPALELSPAELADKYVSAAVRLMSLGLPRFAVINLEALPKSLRNSPAISFLLAKAHFSNGDYHLARETLTAGFGPLADNPPEHAPKEFIDIAFPQIYFNETIKTASKHSVDPRLVWAVIRQESRYDPAAISPAGALGLMQVTPAAVGFNSKRGKVSAHAIADILDPQRNMAHGISILAKNLDAFKGKIIPAVASYNADIRKVRDWVRSNEKLKPDEFIESIPYLETRVYVKKVLAGYKAYSLLHRKKDLVGYW